MDGKMIDYIDNIFLQPNKKIITVYKIFKKVNNQYYNLDQRFQFSENDWNSCYWDKDQKRFDDIILKNNNVEYHSGFHSFIEYEESKIVYSKFYDNEIYKLYCCQAKFRLLYGTKLYLNIGKVNVCVSRGIKMLKELEV
jgi:hypothetical protein